MLLYQNKQGLARDTKLKCIYNKNQVDDIFQNTEIDD